MVKSVITTVLAGVVASILYGLVASYQDLTKLKEQNMYYHGTWPPVREGK